MNHSRRRFLSVSIASWLGGMGMLFPKTLLAVWPKQAFSITEFDEAIQRVTEGKEIIAKNVMLQAPTIAENGAQVRVEVQSDLTRVKSISLLVEKNPVILTSQFLIGPNNAPYVAVNLKIRETSKVLALVETDDKFYSATREVQVTAGGCG